MEQGEQDYPQHVDRVREAGAAFNHRDPGSPEIGLPVRVDRKGGTSMPTQTWKRCRPVGAGTVARGERRRVLEHLQAVER